MNTLFQSYLLANLWLNIILLNGITKAISCIKWNFLWKQYHCESWKIMHKTIYRKVTTSTKSMREHLIIHLWSNMPNILILGRFPRKTKIYQTMFIHETCTCFQSQIHFINGSQHEWWFIIETNYLFMSCVK
jgi:hypothetical protein